ncbi:hypothetical protein P4114_25395 [Pseudomonas aeruginosa]|nr:hypothetical protein [Pseudomonas aeruginosa]
MLCAIAERHCAPRPATRTWLPGAGGDEFVVVSTHVSSKLEIESSASRLIDVINREVAYEGHSSMSAPASAWPWHAEHGGDPRGLLRCPTDDVRGQPGRNTWRFYLEAMDSPSLAEKKLRETELRALAERRVRVVLPAAFPAQEQMIASAEALIRWNHQRRGTGSARTSSSAWRKKAT